MSQPKFTLKSVQHRIRKLELVADVILDGEEKKDYPVSWVKIRGSQDPVYLERVAPHVADYQTSVEDAQAELEGDDKLEQLTKVISESMKKLMIHAVACAIENWDEDFFGEEFSRENAVQLFSDQNNNHIYNQMASYMKKRDAFLPIADI